MLVLTRKEDETIVIDGGITIKIISIRGKCVRIGVEASKEVRVLRGELLQFPKEGKKETTRLPDSSR